MKLSLFSATALLVLGCGGSSGSESKPGPVSFTPEPQPSDDGAAIYLVGRTEGDRVIVDVMAHGVSDLHGTAFRVKWDPDALALVDAQASSEWTKESVLLSKESLPGQLVVAWSEKGAGAGHDATQAIVLGTLVFDAKSRKGSAIAFRTDRSTALDHQGKTLAVAWRSGTVPAR